MKKNVLIIGAGGVAQVVAHKCAQNNDVLGDHPHRLAHQGEMRRHHRIRA
jgi:siroheme synthase (precorrin-2 oxidase/ferrochelatase)